MPTFFETEKQVGRCIAVVGGQFGSEGKGEIAAYLGRAASVFVRHGGVNAGHTVFCDGAPVLMRQLPCGWVTNNFATLALGKGAVVDVSVLFEEIGLIEEFEPEIRKRIKIDPDAAVVTEGEKVHERRSHLARRIASTSARARLGIGEAVADRVLRNRRSRRARDVAVLRPFLCDTVSLVNRTLHDDDIVLIEGTQGFGLSLNHGMAPFVTSRDTTAPALFAETGVNVSRFDTEVVLVCRTYPIRVGGDSGPFPPDSEELTWRQVARYACAPRTLSERTSVTRIERRVATWSRGLFLRAVEINRPTSIALTHLDYLDWGIHGEDDISGANPRVEYFIEEVERQGGVKVDLLKTGPGVVIDTDTYRASILRRIAT